MEENLGEKIKKISEEIANQPLENVSNEELMGYLFLVEKMKKKIEDIIKLAQ